MHPPPPMTRSLPFRYGAAVVCVVLATVVRQLADPVLGDRLPFVTYFAAVVATAWIGGFGPSLLAIVVSAAAASLFFVPPRGEFATPGAPGALGLALFFGAGLTIALFSEALLRARRGAEASARDAAARRGWLQVTLASIGDAVIAVDTDSRVTFLNPVAATLTGWPESDALGRPLAEVFPIIHEQTRQPAENPVARALAAGRVVGLANHTVLIARDGTERVIEDSAAPIVDDAGRVVGVVLVFRDNTAGRRQEQRRAARLAVTQVLAQAGGLDEAAPRLLQAVCENLGWARGALWVVDDAGRTIRCRETWRPPGAPADEFDARSRELVLRPGEGLPGRVWAERKPVWLPDVAVADNFPRAAAAARAGLRAAFACPVTLGDRVLGVVEFFHHTIREPDADKLEMVATLGGQVGQFMERCRAADELRRSERDLADFFENATVGLHWVGPDGTILRVNRTELELLGYSRDEYVGRPIAEFHADAAVIADILRRLHAGETLTDFPARMRCKDGSVRDVLINSSVLWEDGRFVHTRCFTRDVTEQKAAEQALRASERRYRQIVETAQEGVWQIDAAGQTMFANPRMAELLRCTPEELHASSLWDFLDPDQQAEVRGQQQRRMQGVAEQVEVRFRCKDGTPLWGLVSTGPVFDAAGGFAGALDMISDLTARKRLEQTLRFLAEASAALAALTDEAGALRTLARLAVPDFADWCTVDVLDDAGNLRRLAVAHADPAKAALADELNTRHPPDPDTPGGVWQVLRTGDPVLVPEIPDAVLAERIRNPDLLRIVRELGLTSYIGVPLRARGSVFGVIMFIAAESRRRYGPDDLAAAEDLARRAGVAIENARLFAEVQAADRRKDEFLAMLGHELRNPLAPIRTSLEILRLPSAESEQARARDIMDRQVDHLARLVDDLLDVSRIVRGSIELRRAPVDLATVLARAVEASQPLIDAEGHTLTVDVGPAPLWVDGDAVRLAQVVSNLLNNAAKYTPPGGRIWLTAERAADEAIIRVRDTGVGIADDILPKIFDLFVQADRSTKNSRGGMGVGLSLVRSLVDLHGGRVEARSAGKGLGSEFTVRLPLIAAPTTNNRAPRSPAGPRRRVLVVDDNTDAADSLAVLLRLKGHDARVAHDGPAALQAAREYRPELVLLDIGMPGMDGHEVCRRLRQDTAAAGATLVALTGWGQEEDRRRTQEAGFDHHLVKPVDPEDLDRLLAGSNQ